MSARKFQDVRWMLLRLLSMIPWHVFMLSFWCLLKCLDSIFSFSWPEDGMDQAKWAVPRNRGTRAAKSISMMVKPKFKVQGVWCHGTMLRLFVLDPRIPSDSSTILEFLGFSGKRPQERNARRIWFWDWFVTICEHLRCLSQTVQEVIEIFEAKEVPLPKELLIMETCLQFVLVFFLKFSLRSQIGVSKDFLSVLPCSGTVIDKHVRVWLCQGR